MHVFGLNTGCMVYELLQNNLLPEKVLKLLVTGIESEIGKLFVKFK